MTHGRTSDWCVRIVGAPVDRGTVTQGSRCLPEPRKVVGSRGDTHVSSTEGSVSGRGRGSGGSGALLRRRRGSGSSHRRIFGTRGPPVSRLLRRVTPDPDTKSPPSVGPLPSSAREELQRLSSSGPLGRLSYPFFPDSTPAPDRPVSRRRVGTSPRVS